MARGKLRVYLGAAPGVGKTVAMLSEGARRLERGTDVVVAIVEDHGRAFTAASGGPIPVIPRRQLPHRGIALEEMDTDAVLARAPQVALVDELAHTNAPGSDREKRWQDVEVLLDAGIDVITTVNVQHLESLNDVVATITGVVQQETVPDSVVRSSEAIELVDMSPNALRRRMAHGHIYPAERIDTALGHYFREGNLTALRELALLWVADRVDEGLAKYRTAHNIRVTWAARERIVVALTGGPEGTLLLRRGARIAGRVAGRTLVAVHVVRSDGSAGTATRDPAEIERQRILTEKLGGSLQLVVGDDVPRAVLEFARSVNGTQIVVGASRHGRFSQLVRPSTVMSIVRESGDIDVHVVTHPRASRLRRRPGLRVGKRSAWTWVAAVAVPGVLAAALAPFRSGMNLTTVLLVFLLGVLANALVGGVVPAAVAALIAGLLANYLFTPPFGSLIIASPQNAFALVAFLVVGITVASVVDRSSARARDAARGSAQAQLLASVATGTVASSDPVAAVLSRARIGFGMTAVVLWHVREGRDGMGPSYELVARSGTDVSVIDRNGPEGADVLVHGGSEWAIALYGHPLPATEHRLVEVFAAQAALAVERQRLGKEAAETDRLRQADSVRTAVLAALSHDLRTPLATIKASVSSLRDGTISLSAQDRADLLQSTDFAAEQLDALLANLLDLSRLQTGVLTPVRRPCSVDEVVHGALIGLPAGSVTDSIPDDIPLMDTDGGLLERVLANVVANAVRFTPSGRQVRIDAGPINDEQGRRVQIRVVDHGPGVPEKDREAMFAPFQRLGDVPAGSGVGLGLAVARGLAEAVGAQIEVEDTPGGGLTMMISVPVAATAAPAAPAAGPAATLENEDPQDRGSLSGEPVGPGFQLSAGEGVR